MTATDETASQAPPAGVVAVFISYAREDADFVRRVHGALVAAGRGVWVDWEDIPASADWRSEIGAGIAAAENFVFALSPDSLASEECAKELEYAVEHGKRIVPIVCRDSDGAATPPELASRNWILCRAEDDFDAAMGTLARALDTDLDWVRAHTRLLVRAREWEQKGRDGSLVLRGADLREAEAALAAAAREPEPNQLQREYVLAGRRAATRRQRATLAAVLVALAVAAALALLAFVQRNQAMESERRAVENERRAVANERTARSREIAASAVANLGQAPDLSLLLAREANAVEETPEAVEALRRSVAASHLAFALPRSDLSMESAAFTPDGRILVTGGADRFVRTWDVRTRRRLAAVENKGAPDSQLGYTPTLAAVSPVGRVVASTGLLGSVLTVWDAATGRELGRLRGLPRVSAFEFSPDGRRLAIATSPGARIWDWRTGGTRVLRGHRRLTVSARFSADGARVVTAGDEGTARIWDARTGRLRRVVDNRLESDEAANRIPGLVDAFFTPNGRQLVTVDGDGTAGVWLLATGKRFAAVGGRDLRIDHAVVTPNGRLLVTGSDDGTAHVWSLPDGKRVSEFGGHGDAVTSIAVDRTGAVAATASEDGTARLWAPRTGEELAVLRGHSGSVSSVALSGDGRLAATASTDGTARAWRVEFARPVLTLRPHGSDASEVAFSPDGTTFATAGDTSAELRRAPSGRLVATFEHPDQVEDVGFSPTGEYVVTTGADDIARVWSSRSRRPLAAFPAHVSVSPEFSADGKYVVNHAFGSTAFVRRIPSGTLVARLPAQADIRRATLSPDAKLAVTTDEDGALVWDAAAGRSLRPLRGGADGIDSAAFSPDNRRIVTTGSGTLRVFDARSGRPIRTAAVPDAGDAWFGPDGDTILTSGGNTRLWDARTLSLRATLGTQNQNPVFSRDGRFVLTSNEAVATVWDADSALAVTGFRVPGGLNRAAFSGDGTLVVASSHTGTAYLFACDVCRPLGPLLALARQRSPRELTADERAHYLHQEQGAPVRLRQAVSFPGSLAAVSRRRPP